MFSNECIMPHKNNSEIVKQVIDTLINTIIRKRGEKCAVSMVDSLINELKDDYDFLKYVNILDIRLLEEKERVIITSDYINKVSPVEIGIVLHKIILSLSRSLGDKEGYFLIREFQQRVGSEYFSTIKDIGLDTEKLLLEHILSSARFTF